MSNGDIDDLRRAVVAVLSHSILRQHLPEGMTFTSDLWTALRDLAGEQACSAVSEEIRQTEALLRRTCGREGGKE